MSLPVVMIAKGFEVLDKAKLMELSRMCMLGIDGNSCRRILTKG